MFSTQNGRAEVVTYKNILVDRRGSAIWLTLNRPKAMNALSPELVTELGDAASKAETDPDVRALVITGTGKAFCAGADLKLIADGDDYVANIHAFMEIATPIFDRIRGSRLPVIAAVQGIALAGGLELILCCDLVIAAQRAQIGDAHANFGLVPGGGGGVRLTQRIGPLRAREFLFTGSLYPAEKLESMGLVNQTVADDKLLETVEKLVEQLAAKSPRSIACMKKMVSNALSMSYQECLVRESEMCIEHAGSFDAKEGLAAFADNRSPEFTGL